MGRPSSYKPEYVKVAYNLALLGATDVEIGNAFDVSEQTINNWKKEYPDFSLALKDGKTIADAEVAASLNKRARGFRYVEVTKELNGVGQLVVTKEVTKEVAPDTGAAMAWLKNRRSKNWRDKQEVQVDSHNVNENITSIADLLNDPVKDREIPEE